MAGKPGGYLVKANFSGPIVLIFRPFRIQNVYRIVVGKKSVNLRPTHLPSFFIFSINSTSPSDGCIIELHRLSVSWYALPPPLPPTFLAGRLSSGMVVGGAVISGPELCESIRNRMHVHLVFIKRLLYPVGRSACLQAQTEVKNENCLKIPFLHTFFN